MEKTTKQDTVDFSSWKGLEKKLCATCQDMLVTKMKPIHRDLNSGSKLKEARAQINIARMQPKLWKGLCKDCLRKMKKEVL